MTWFDILTVILFAIVSGISVFCWIYTFVSFWRKKDSDTLFPKKD